LDRFLAQKIKSTNFLFVFLYICRSMLVSKNISASPWAKLLILTVFCNYLEIKAQKMDSLLNELKVATEDTNKIILLNKIAINYRYNDFGKGMNYAKQALSLCKKLGYLKEEAQSNYNIGVFYLLQGQLNESVIFLRQAEELAQKTGNKKGEANAISLIGGIYFQNEQYDEALKLRLKALKIQDDIKDNVSRSSTVLNIALIFCKMNQYGDALNYFKKALTLKQELGDKKGESFVYANMGSMLYDIKKWKEAEEYFIKVLEIQKELNDISLIANCNINLGNIYLKLNKQNQAKIYLEESLKLYALMGDTVGTVMSLNSIGTLESDLNKNNEAVETHLKALGILNHSQDKTPLKAIYDGLKKAYSNLGDDKKALEYYEKAVEIDKKIYTEDLAKKISKLKEQYELEKKDKNILVLTEQNATTNALSEKRKLWIITACSFAAILLLSLVLIITINRSRKKQKEIAFIKTKAELEQTALLAQMNPHFIFNALNSIQYYILSKETEYAYDYLAKFSKLIRQVLINSEQNTIALNKEIETLQLYIELEQRRLKNRFDFEINYANDFPAHDITIPTMLIQPFVENAIWHGIMNMPEDKKGKLVLNFSLTGKQLRISVEDNGVGRKEAALRKVNNEYKSVGVMFTQKRLELLKTVTKQESEIIITDLIDANGKAIGTKVEILMEIVA
jgi:tetratricopeptide (TPR) repeat protein